MSTEEFKEAFKQILTDFEQQEVSEFPTIYYFPEFQRRKILSEEDYSTEEKDYNNLDPGEHISYRYQILSKLGKGSFGSVVKVIDHKNGKTVALKII